MKKPTRATVDQPQFVNCYECPCGETWNDVWDCACNDKCPKCNKEIEPYKSEETTERKTDP